MSKFKFSLKNIFLLYVGVLLSFFLYAGLTGTRILGDNKEKYEPEGVQQRYHGSTRVYRSYHK